MAIIVDKDGNVVTVENEPEEARAMFPNSRDFGVGDVLINEKSIVNQYGNAEIPIASSSNHGVVLVSGDGLEMVTGGRLRVNTPQSNRIKEGQQLYQPVDIYHQHEAVFYGLSKISGYDLKDETVTLGTYPEEAKIAIQKMLGIYEAPWELIDDATFTNEIAGDYVINADSSSEPLELTEAILMFETPVQNAVAVFGGSGVVRFVTGSGSIDTFPGGYTQEANAAARGFTCYFQQHKGGLIITKYSTQTSSTNGGNLQQRFYTGLDSAGSGVHLMQNAYVTYIRIVNFVGTGHYKLFGRRR